ncbi:MAG: hypothetical protein AABY83_13565 [Pseudomonadota bacterium]
MPLSDAADVTSGFIMEKTWGNTNNKAYGSATGFRVGLNAGVPGLNVEGTYAVLGRFQRKTVTNRDIEVKAFSVVGLKPFPLGQTLTISPMVGVNQWQTCTANAGECAGSDKGLGVLYGVQMADQYYPSLSVRMSYVRNENIANLRIDTLTLGVVLSY